MLIAGYFFNAHGRPKEESQQKLTDARRASRGRNLPYSIRMKCKLFLHLPECCGVGRKLAAAAEIVGRIRNQILRHAAACVKVCGIRCLIGIDSHKDALVLAFPLENALLVGEDDGTEVAVI